MTTIHVTEAESAVMEALWRCGPLPPTRLIAEVRRGRPWGDATVKTLLGRLMQKKAVRSVKEGGLLRYHPEFDRRTYVDAELRALAARLFGGDLAAMRAALGEAEMQAELSKLSPKFPPKFQT
jgi:BlaI family transcriptional regulator, penicillinase repressor